MNFFKIGLFVASVIASTSSYAQSPLPEFSTYLVPKNEVFKGTPAAVDLSNYEGANTYRTKLREGAKSGPNFAGHYTVVSFGCGTQCQDNWIIDAKSGKILYRFSSVLGTQYHLDSSLLIINPADLDMKRGYEEHPEQPLLGDLETFYEVWKNNKFNVIHKDKWVNVIKTLP